jgi:hypothetical protein
MLGFLKKKGKKPEDLPAEDAKKKEMPKERPVVVNPPEEKKAVPVEAEEPVPADDQSEDKNGAYFVSPHPDGGWQVKKAKAKKALKRFDTKAEAEKYAKTVAKNQDSSVVRQKKDGKIQKKH